MSKITRKIFLAATLLVVQTSFGQAVFQSFDLVVSDPAAVVAAMDKYQASPTGQSNTSIAILYQYVAAGDNMATHAVNIVHSSPEEMDANLERNQGSSDQAAFFAEVSQVATITRRWMGQILLTGGSVDNLTNPNPAAMAYFMSVSDPAAYAQAFSNFIGQNEDVGQSFLSSIMADGEDPATHVVLNYGNSLGELVMNQPQALDGWSDYASDVRDLRTVEATAVLNVVKRWD
tara:strand:+ start:470 stop:1165 length:696 start_codon:yes stop_codon:yes gene_type:complete